MEHFPKFEVKPIGQAPPGASVSFEMRGMAYFGIVSEALQPPGVAVMALWGPGDGWTPAMVRLGAGVQVLIHPAAKAILSQDPAHLRFRHVGGALPFGAVFLVGDEPHVLARVHDNSTLVRLRDGVQINVAIGDLLWFAAWSIAIPDVDDRWRTMWRFDLADPSNAAAGLA